MAETGLPGKPKAGLPLTNPMTVGLPGLMASPWTSTPG